MPFSTGEFSAADYFNRTSQSNPVFVDATTIAYLDDSSGTNQLFFHDLLISESRQVTDYTEGILSLTASAASGAVMFGIDQRGDERQQLYVLPNVTAKAIRITHDDTAFFEPGGLSSDGNHALYRTNSRDESTFDVAVIRIDGTSSKVWLENGGQVLPQDLSAYGALVIQSKGNPADDLILVSENGDTRNFTKHLAPHRVYYATFDPDGKTAWVLSELDREFAALFSLDLDAGDFTPVFEADWGVELVSVSPDGKHLALSVNDNGYSTPYIVSSKDPADRRSIESPRGVIDRFSWSPDSSMVAFGVSTSETPSRLYVAYLEGKSQPLLEQVDDNPVPTVAAQPVQYASWDGREVPAYLFLPDGPGPHPALIEIHGGPESQRRPDYTSVGAAIQYLVSQGIAVLALNIRGSIGYGRTYRHLDDRDKRLDALHDVEYAAQWLGNRADIDAKRLAVFGISYGGFITLSALTRLPHVWAAGAEMVGMAHLETFLERTGPWRRPNREAEYGTLAEDREMLRNISPLQLVDQIDAPLLVFHGRNDARVPLFESEQIVEAVSQRGVDVELIVYDDEGHIFTKRQNLIDAYSRIGEFLKKHLGV